MKAFVCLLFSLLIFSAYSESSLLDDSLNSFEQINSEEISADCAPEGASVSADQEEGPSFLSKMTTLSHQGKMFNCSEKVIEGCHYSQCTAPGGMFSTYPKPIAILIPKGVTTVKSFKVHIHGFSYFNKKYDKSLDSMVDSFKFGKGTCKRKKELILVPYSAKNKNTFHHNYLGSTKKFDGFMSEFQSIIGVEDSLPVSLSGHSGGGRVISKIVSYITHDPVSKSAARRVREVGIYDGLYANDRVTNFASWFERSKNVEMNIYSIRGSTTSGYSSNLFNKFSDNAQTTSGQNAETQRSYSIRRNQWGQNKVSHIEEKPRGGEHHWELARDYWSFDP